MLRFSILVVAASKGDLLLLERALGGNCGEYTEEDVRKSLLRASCLGNVECVSRLLAHGADPDCEDLDGDSPLMLAVCNNHISQCMTPPFEKIPQFIISCRHICKLLIRLGAIILCVFLSAFIRS